jgi:hypothetical protein
VNESVSGAPFLSVLIVRFSGKIVLTPSVWVYVHDC